jgi:hypothetical protein
MTEQNIENLDSQNEEQEVAKTTEETTEEVDVEALKEQNKKLFERAKKAEGFTKDENGEWVKKPKPEVKEETPKNTSDLSSDDLLALADIKDKEDRKFLIEKSKEMNKSISDLQEDIYIKAALKLRAEERITAEATTTGKGNRGTKSTSPGAIINAAHSGKEVDPDALAEAELAQQLEDAKKRGIQGIQ